MDYRVWKAISRVFILAICFGITGVPVSGLNIMVFEQTDKTAPISQALIYANSEYVATTDLNGTYNLTYEGDPPSLRIAKAGYRDWTGVPPLNDTLLLAPLQVRNCSYTIQVFDADSLLPIQGALVRAGLEDIDSGRSITDQNGSITLSLRSEQVYDLVITSRNYQTIRDKLVTGFENGEKQYSMIKNDRLSLFVKDSLDNKPIAGSILRADGSELGKTNENGILITNLSRGKDHTIEAEANGYEKTVLAINPSEKDLILDLSLVRLKSHVFVSVYDEDKRPVEGVQVFINGNMTGITNGYGRVSVPNLELKQYEFMTSKEGFETGTRTEEITSDTTDITFEIRPSKSVLHVMVQDSTGTPLPNVSVFIDNSSEELTRSNGTTFFELHQGTYRVDARKDTYLSNNTTITLPLKQPVVLSLSPEEYRKDNTPILWLPIGGGVIALIAILIIMFLRGRGGNKSSHTRKKRSVLRKRSL